MEANIAALSKYQISRFFEKNASVTQEQCDQEAERQTDMHVHATSVQGGNSYTVVSDDETCVVQFRANNSALDMNLLGCVEQAYEGFVPHHHFVGNVGEVHVYTMDNVGGISMYLARDKLFQNDCFLLRQTVTDFARFFASPWHKTPSQMACPSRSALFNEYSSELAQLQLGLPERFCPTLDRLISKLPDLFDKTWPLVPNHADLLENNIHVSAETGRLTGVCDWKDTTICPFGVSLGGLETMLGIWTTKREWRYHANQQELRDLFWAAFYEAMGNASETQKELIEVARLVGLFLANGFEWTSDGVKIPVREGYIDLRYLEAVTLTLLA